MFKYLHDYYNASYYTLALYKAQFKLLHFYFSLKKSSRILKSYGKISSCKGNQTAAKWLSLHDNCLYSFFTRAPTRDCVLRWKLEQLL